MNCKAGDLAIIIGSKFQGNLGAIVGVLKLAPPDCWEVAIDGRPLQGTNLATGRSEWSGTAPRERHVIKDCYLRPLTGLDQAEIDQIQRGCDLVTPFSGLGA